MSILDAFYSLGGKTNKATGEQNAQETEEGISSEKFPELKLDMKNADLVDLTKEWKKKWEESEVYSVWQEACKVNEEYWKGKQFDLPKSDKNRPLIDNVIFESVETYLPQVTRRNPDPMVMLSRKAEQSKENLNFASELQKELVEIADEIVLRLKLRKSARHWVLSLLGVIKVGWDLNKDIPTAKALRPEKIILDPDATVDEDGYTGKFIGEYVKKEAGELIDLLEEIGGEKEGIKKIKDKTKDNRGTEVTYIEFWTGEYTCWKLDDKILYKGKNSHWNYNTKEESPYNEDGTPQTDEEGNIKTVSVPGVNHLSVPSMPYIFLSVFNLGKQPVDDTSLIGQNLSTQDLINKRIRQIDKNADSMNGAIAVSLERAGMSIGQARGINDAVRRGGTIAIPAGSVNEALVRLSAPSLPNDVYLQLTDTRSRVRDIFGIRGSSAAGLQDEKTVRGKIQSRLLDTDRIGGGFSEYLEQMADRIYNWFVQLLYVYDANYKGKDLPKIRVSVKDGSLLPKDSTTLANQAIELAGQNRMSLIDLYKALDYPNPEELAANVWLEANAPELLLNNDSRVQQVMQTQKENAGNEQKPVSKSINFKDLPPEGQAQLAFQAGLQLNPEAVAAYNESKMKKEATKDIMVDLGKKAINDINQNNQQIL